MSLFHHPAWHDAHAHACGCGEPVKSDGFCEICLAEMFQFVDALRSNACIICVVEGADEGRIIDCEYLRGKEWG